MDNIYLVKFVWVCFVHLLSILTVRCECYQLHWNFFSKFISPPCFYFHLTLQVFWCEARPGVMKTLEGLNESKINVKIILTTWHIWAVPCLEVFCRTAREGSQADPASHLLEPWRSRSHEPLKYDTLLRFCSQSYHISSWDWLSSRSDFVRMAAL